MSRIPPSFDLVLTTVLDRFEALLSPPSGEASPLLLGGEPHAWAVAAGLHGELPHEAVREIYGTPYDTSPHDADTVAHVALQRLCQRSRVDHVGAMPHRYRPRHSLGIETPSRRRRS